MKSLISFSTEFYEKRKFEQTDEDNFLISFAKVLLIFIVLFVAWTGFFHYKEIDYMKNGTDVVAKVTISDESNYFSFVAEDGITYQGNLPKVVLFFSQKSGISHSQELNGGYRINDGDEITAYYKDDPGEALVPTKTLFYVIKYVISALGICLVILWINKLKE